MCINTPASTLEESTPANASPLHNSQQVAAPPKHEARTSTVSTIAPPPKASPPDKRGRRVVGAQILPELRHSPRRTNCRARRLCCKSPAGRLGARNSLPLICTQQLAHIQPPHPPKTRSIPWHRPCDKPPTHAAPANKQRTYLRQEPRTPTRKSGSSKHTANAGDRHALHTAISHKPHTGQHAIALKHAAAKYTHSQLRADKLAGQAHQTINQTAAETEPHRSCTRAAAQLSAPEEKAQQLHSSLCSHNTTCRAHEAGSGEVTASNSSQ